MSIMPRNPHRSRRVARLSEGGFTLVELMIATAIFSFVIVVMSTGLVRLLHFYQSTVNIRATQEAARQVADDITDQGRNSSLVTVTASSPGHVTDPAYGSQPESEICFFTNVAHQADGTIIGSGVIYYTVQSGANQWRVYQAHFSDQQTAVTGGGTCDPPTLTDVAAITPASISFIRFAGTASADDRLVQLNMVISGTDQLDPVQNINYADTPAPTCFGGDYNNYCSITDLQVAAEVRKAQQ